MKNSCPKCKKENINSANFCEDCGTFLSLNGLRVRELNQKATDNGFSVHHNNEIMANWSYFEPIENIYFGRYSALRLHPTGNVIVPPDIICYENANHIFLYDHEYEGNLKTQINLTLQLEDVSFDIGIISLKIYDVDFALEGGKMNISFICDFD